MLLDLFREFAILAFVAFGGATALLKRAVKGATAPAGGIPNELLDALPPFRTGGSMITDVTIESAEYLPAPLKFEAGTQPVSQAVGLAAAVRYLEGLDMGAVHAREQDLGNRMIAGLREIPGVRVLGEQDRR